MTLLITCAVLGGLVVILSLIYAYIYCTKMNPRHRPKGVDGSRTQFYPQGQSTAIEVSQCGETSRKKPMHPFLLWGYAAKFRKESIEQA